ncbi:MAG: YiiX/YebB-like N1pC/P60 family cysteine hydrolase [Bacteriovorax sp.]|nr:YiiX/YebB-like N1pC/P60 family cysteine hydrolase [Bacteriovorax sp.]
MKFLSILLMASIVLWNPSKAQAQASDSVSASDQASLNTLDKTEKVLDTTIVKFQNPFNDVNLNLNSFSVLLKSFNEFKVYDVNFINSLLAKIKNNDTLSGKELFDLRRTITIYYKINKKILDFAKVYDFGGFKMSKTFASEDRNLPLIKAHLIWLSGHLLVLDHLVVLHSLLYENEGIFRRIVKNALLDKSSNVEGTSKTLDDLIKMSKYTVEIGESLKFSQQINLVRAIEVDLKVLLSDEAAATLLVDTIVTNKTASDIARGKTKFELENFTFVDSLLQAFDKVTGFLSRIFGNIAGSIHWRKGYLYNNKTAKEIAVENLRPMDILIEKSPFVLTDKFIPGHYGHIAVYLGTREQLEAIDMWTHPDIVPYQEDIIAGKVILEAVRSGVRLNTVEEFMNIDELTIMTKVDGLSNPSLLIEEITRGMDQIGKDYDFNFDISTLDKIVCSELIYITFGNVHWPTQYRLGRATITPDDVAEILFQKNTKFKIKNFMVSKEDHRIELVNMSYIADELDYELRTVDGNPVQDQKDSTNSYWKKETKCYTIKVKPESAEEEEKREDSFDLRRFCKTSYKEFYYEEREVL